MRRRREEVAAVDVGGDVVRAQDVTSPRRPIVGSRSGDRDESVIRVDSRLDPLPSAAQAKEYDRG